MLLLAEIGELGMDIREKVEMKIKEAQMASEDWILLQENLKLEVGKNNKVILFPKETQLIYEAGLKYLDTFVMRHDIDKAYVVYVDEFIGDTLDEYSKNTFVKKQISETQMNRLITLYSLYPMEDKVTVVSLDKPFMRWGSKLKGVKGVTEEQLIAIGAYGIIPFRKIG